LSPFHHLQSLSQHTGTVPATGIIYHGGQSSTSSDLSPPMSDKNKSLPRRGRSRYHLVHHINTNTTPRHHKTISTNNSKNSPQASPRASCKLAPSSPHQNQIVSRSNLYGMTESTASASRFRPINVARTINLTKAIP